MILITTAALTLPSRRDPSRQIKHLPQGNLSCPGGAEREDCCYLAIPPFGIYPSIDTHAAATEANAALAGATVTRGTYFVTVPGQDCL